MSITPGTQPLIAGEIIDLLARAEIKGIKEDVHLLAQKVDTLASKADIATLSHSISVIASKQDRAAQPQYSLMVSAASFVVFVLTVIGAFAYWPIQRDTNRLDTAVSLIAERGVFQKQYDGDQQRTQELLRNLRSDVNITIQQQRYNIDQERLGNTLAAASAQVDLLKNRTYEMNTRLATVEAVGQHLEKTLLRLIERVNEIRRDRRDLPPR